MSAEEFKTVKDMLDGVEGVDQKDTREPKKEKELSDRERREIRKMLEEKWDQEKDGAIQLTQDQLNELHAIMDDAQQDASQEDQAKTDVEVFVEAFEGMIEKQDPEAREVDAEYIISHYMDDANVSLEYLSNKKQELQDEKNTILKKYHEAIEADDKAAQSDLLQKLRDVEQQYYGQEKEYQEACVQLLAVRKQKKELLDTKKETPEGLGDGEEEEYQKLEAYLNEFDEAVKDSDRRQELAKKEGLSDAEKQELETLNNKQVSEWIRAIQQHSLDTKDSPKFREMTDLVREKKDIKYTVASTQEYIDALKTDDNFETIKTSANTVIDAFRESDSQIPEATLGTLENIIWRHASNNQGFSSELPFLAHDMGTQQAFIYYPDGSVQICRAHHGEGPLGSNTPNSHGTSLGSKRLTEGLTMGGDYKARTIVHGLEQGVNDRDFNRAIRIHEKAGGMTWGCTGLPFEVASKFAHAVKEAGGGAQETFISDGQALPENWGEGVQQSMGTYSDALSGQMEFAGKGEVQAFLEKVKKNPFLRIMLMFLAPLGLMMARAEGNEMMIMFWEELLGQRDGQEGANSSAGGRAGGYPSGINRVRQGESAAEYLTGGSLHQIGEFILNQEAGPPDARGTGRRDAAGNLAVYKLPSSDGGGKEEVAGINEKYHGPALQELKALINAGKHEEAKEYAVNYILEWTGKENRVRSTNMGLELFMRDATFNRGGTGSATIASRALQRLHPDAGITDGGDWTKQKQELWTQMEQGGPEEVKRLIGALRWARQHYEENEKGRKPGHDLYKGLENRWNAVEKAALGFSAKPLPGTEKFTGQNKHDTRLVGDYKQVLENYETAGGGILPGTHAALMDVHQKLQGMDPSHPEYEKHMFAATSLANYMDVHNKGVPYSFPPVGIGSEYARACASLSDCIVETSNSAMQNLHRKFPGKFETSDYHDRFGGNARKSYSNFFGTLQQSNAGKRLPSGNFSEVVEGLNTGKYQPGTVFVSIRGGGHGGLLLPGGYMVDSSGVYKRNGSAIGERKLSGAHEIFILDDPEELYNEFKK